MNANQLLEVHPCYSNKAHKKYCRIHLAVAPKCNIQCNYCDRKIGVSYHTFRPSIAYKIIFPQEALDLVTECLYLNSLKVVGIAGTGEPLYNKETFETLELVHKTYPDLILCIATNGLLLTDYAEELAPFGVKAVTVTVNCINPDVGAKIYSYIRHKNQKLSGTKGAKLLLENQLNGIALATKLGIVVKVNTLYIPGINEQELVKIATEIKKAGARIQNITPLIPLHKFKHLPHPTPEQLSKARETCEKIIPQFTSCEQCRADFGCTVTDNKIVQAGRYLFSKHHETKYFKSGYVNLLNKNFFLNHKGHKERINS